VVSAIAGLEEAKKPSGGSPPPDSDLFDAAEFGKNLDSLSRQSVNKRSQLFFRTQNVIVAVIAAIIGQHCSLNR